MGRAHKRARKHRRQRCNIASSRSGLLLPLRAEASRHARGGLWRAANLHTFAFGFYLLCRSASQDTLGGATPRL